MELASNVAVENLGLRHGIRRGLDEHSPVVFFIHGRAGNLSVMSAFNRCVPNDFTIIYPEAFLPDPSGGFSWWDISKEEGLRESITFAKEKLFAFMRDSLTFYSLNPEKRFAAGFSQGGAILSLILQDHPEFLDKAALLASFVLSQDEKPKGTRLPLVFMAHGTLDGVVSIDRARQGACVLQEKGFSVTYIEDDTGHKVGTKGMAGLKEWIGV